MRKLTIIVALLATVSLLTAADLVSSAQAPLGKNSASIGKSRVAAPIPAPGIDSPDKPPRPLVTFINEGFNGVTFPPAGWSMDNLVDPWGRVTTTSYPSGYAPYEGAGMAEYDIYNIYTGEECRLITPTFNPAGAAATVAFGFFRNNYTDYGDRLYLEYRLNSGAWTAVATLNPYSATTTGWTAQSFTLPALTGTVEVAFHGYSNYGYRDLYVDGVQIYSPNAIDLSAVAIRVPKTAVVRDTSFYPVVKIQNRGTSAASSIPVTVWIDSAGTRLYNQTATVAGPLAQNDTALVPMTTIFNAKGAGLVYAITAFTDMTGEQDRANDTVKGSFATTGLVWSQVASAPLGLYRTAGVSDNSGHFYVLGGQDAANVQQSAVYCYTKATNTWSTLAPLPAAFSNLTAAFVASTNCLYVFGGYDGTNPKSTVYIYDILTNTWTLGSTPLPVADYGLACATLGDTVFVKMGASTAFYAYDVTTSTFSARAVAPVTPAAAAMCVYGGNVYMSGGWTALTGFYRYNVGANTWTTLASLPVGRNGHGMTVMDNKIWVYGGGNTWTAIGYGGGMVYWYDPAQPALGWVPENDMRLPQHAGAYAEGSLIASCGLDAAQARVTFTEIARMPFADDVGVIGVISPVSPVVLRNLAPITPQVVVKNLGTAAQTNIPVACTIFGAGHIAVYTDAATIPSLASGATVNVTFTNTWTPTGADACTLVARTGLTGDDDPVNDLALRQILVVPAYMTGGPDAYGYRWIDSDANGGPAYNWIDISTSGTNVPFTGYDDAFANIPVGFSFDYYGTAYTSINVVTNGFLNFGTGSSALTNDSVPTVAAPNAGIYPYWDDLHCLAAGTVKYQTLGTTPNCTLVVSWNGIRRYGVGDSTLTFQALFCEASGDIILQYADVNTNSPTTDGGLQATVGIENADGAVGLNYEFNGKPMGNLLSASRAIRFYLPPPHNVGATHILAPTGTINNGAVVTPACSVFNYGGETETYDVRMKIGTGYEQTATVTDHATGTALYVTFPTWTASSNGTFAVTCSTELATDVDNSNDCVTGSVEVVHRDYALTNILAPVGDYDTSATIIPRVRIYNYGTQTLPTCTLFVNIRDTTGTINFSDTNLISPPVPGDSRVYSTHLWDGAHPVGTYLARFFLVVEGDLNPSNDTISGLFTVSARPPTQPGWAQQPAIPGGPKNKGVKDGGSLTQIEEGDTAMVYAFKGNGRYEFYQYNTNTNTWTTKESIPAIGRAGKKKAVKKGATLSSTTTAIYGSKGNNSVEFWQYTPGTDGAWAQKADVPVGIKNCKEGCDAVTVNVGGTDYIYFLKGTNSTEFYRYNTATDVWETKAPAPVGTSGKNFKNGSNLAYDEDKNVIYAVKGSYNEFFSYSVDSDRWAAPLANVPLVGTSGKKKKVKDGCGMVYNAGNVYVLKGGNTNEFWMYKVDSGASWSQLADMPTGAKRVKGGGALVYVPAMNALYAFRGNNQFEFFIYGLASFMPAAKAPAVSAMGDANRNATAALRIAPNPFSNATTISYSLPSAGNVSLKLYDITGKLVTTLTEGYRTAGSFTANVDARNLSRGIYLVKLATDANTTTTKLIVE